MEHNIHQNKRLMVICLLLFASLVSVLGELVDNNDNGKESVHIMAVLPTHSDNSPTLLEHWPQWERGEEILPGAQLAVDEINDSPYLLIDYEINIIPTEVRLCNPINNIEYIIGNITSKNNSIVAIIGYFCDNLTRFFSRLFRHNKLGIIQIPAMPAITANSHFFSQDHHILSSPVVLAKAALKFIQRLAIRHIGVISNGFYHDTHYSKMTEEFLQKVRETDMTVEFELRQLTNSPRITLSKLRNSTARLLVAFLPPYDALDIICNAYLQGFKWPYYTWVYVEIDSIEVTTASTKVCSQNAMIDSVENVVFLDLKALNDGEDNNIFTTLGNGYTTHNGNYLLSSNQSQNNIYASVLYDSVWAIALALNGSMNRIRKEVVVEKLSRVMFQGDTGFVNFSKKGAAVQVSVGIFQVRQGNTVLIGSYDTSHDQLYLNMSILDNIPSGEPEHLYLLYPPYLTAILCSYMGLSLIFTTMTMSLFIHYRNTPKVKATSSILSLCMFVGCYCLIISSLTHTIASSLIIVNNGLRYANCWGNIFLYTVGMDLVLATVFAKTLRIYHIFNKFGKISSLWSDKSLFVLILGVVSLKVALMVAWGAVDINYLIDEIISPLQGFPPHYIVVQKCYSHHLNWWVTFVFGYSIMLSLPMIHVAVLTRNIKRREFNDSKKICALVAILFFLMCIGTSLWFLLRAIGEYIASKIIFSIGFSSTAVICQIFLLIPKITPSLCAIKLALIRDRLREGIIRQYKGSPTERLAKYNESQCTQ